jgi:hypothetical protein
MRIQPMVAKRCNVTNESGDCLTSLHSTFLFAPVQEFQSEDNNTTRM